VIEDGATREQAIDRLADKYPQYRERRPAGPVVMIHVTRIVTWEAAARAEPTAGRDSAEWSGDHSERG
jgi:hypothetical protein